MLLIKLFCQKHGLHTTHTTMPQTQTRKLDSEDRCPKSELNLIGGGRIELPTQSWTLLLIRRVGRGWSDSDIKSKSLSVGE